MEYLSESSIIIIVAKTCQGRRRQSWMMFRNNDPNNELDADADADAWRPSILDVPVKGVLANISRTLKRIAMDSLSLSPRQSLARKKERKKCWELEKEFYD